MDERHIGFEIKSLSNLIKRRFDAINGSDGMTGMQGFIIGYIYHHPEQEIFQRDIEKKCSIRRSTATGILKLMEKNDWITRESVDYDARLKRLVLTDKAKTNHQRFMEEIDNVEACLQANLSDEDIRTFYRIIDQMKKNLS